MSKMCHAHYEEKDPERSFFMVEAFRRNVPYAETEASFQQ